MGLCSSGTPCLCPRAYKACVGCSLWILCVVVVHHAFAQELIRHAWGAFLVDVRQNPKASQKWVKLVEETHIAWEQNRAGLAPQSGQIACAGNPPHKNALFEGSAHLKYCPLWRFSPQAKGLPCSRYMLDIRTILLPTPECKARLYHYWW